MGLKTKKMICHESDSNQGILVKAIESSIEEVFHGGQYNDRGGNPG
jgi:hypothetical protein